MVAATLRTILAQSDQATAHGHLPVQDSGVVIGMISRSDLLSIGAAPLPRLAM